MRHQYNMRIQLIQNKTLKIQTKYLITQKQSLQIIKVLAIKNSLLMEKTQQLAQQKNIKTAEKLIALHQAQALESYKKFQQNLFQKLQSDLKIIETQLTKQLSKVARKLDAKIKGGYASSLKTDLHTFFLQPFVTKQYEQINESLRKLKVRIYQYINQFCDQVMAKNIERSNQVSLFYYDNKIHHVFSQWYSVTSRSSLTRAEIVVRGLNRPTTSWLALGVSKNMKEYGIVKGGSMKNESFVGNIYLNGSENLNGEYKMKRDLVNEDVFVIENFNRMIYVYRKNQKKNPNEVFILEDNTSYYFYIAMKGPITIWFTGE